MICNPVHGQFPEIISILFRALLIFGLFFCSYILCKFVIFRFYLNDIWKRKHWLLSDLLNSTVDNLFVTMMEAFQWISQCKCLEWSLNFKFCWIKTKLKILQLNQLSCGGLGWVWGGDWSQKNGHKNDQA